MIHIHCDRCKADIDPEGKIGKVSWGFKNGIEGAITSDLLYGRVYCERCMDLTMAFIQSDTESARGQIKAQGGKRERLAQGDDIMNLYRKGIKVKIISEKLGLTPKQVSAYIYNHKEE